MANEDFDKTALPIDDVLNATGQASGDTIESLTNIINASFIGDDNYKNATYTNQLVIQNKVPFENSYSEFINKLSAHSTRFNNNEQFNKLGAINENLKNLSTEIKNYASANINDIITQYNDRLSQLKKGAKLKLLRMKADEINEQAKKGTSTYIIQKDVEFKNHKNEPKDHEVDRNTWRHYNKKDKVLESGDDTHGAPDIYEGTYTDYVYMNYWGTVNSIDKWYDFWPFNASDDDLADLENRFESHKIPLPYERARRGKHPS